MFTSLFELWSAAAMYPGLTVTYDAAAGDSQRALNRLRKSHNPAASVTVP